MKEIRDRQEVSRGAAAEHPARRRQRIRNRSLEPPPIERDPPGIVRFAVGLQPIERHSSQLSTVVPIEQPECLARVVRRLDPEIGLEPFDQTLIRTPRILNVESQVDEPGESVSSPPSGVSIASRGREGVAENSAQLRWMVAKQSGRNGRPLELPLRESNRGLPSGGLRKRPRLLARLLESVNRFTPSPALDRLPRWPATRPVAAGARSSPRAEASCRAPREKGFSFQT